MAASELFGGKDATANTLVATQGFVDDNPKVAQALFLGLADACALIRSDPKLAIDIYLKSEKVQLSREETEKIITDDIIGFQVEPQGLMTWSKYMHEQGALTKMPEKWQDLFFPMIGDRKGS